MFFNVTNTEQQQSFYVSISLSVNPKKYLLRLCIYTSYQMSDLQSKEELSQSCSRCVFVNYNQNLDVQLHDLNH